MADIFLLIGILSLFISLLFRFPVLASFISSGMNGVTDRREPVFRVISKYLFVIGLTSLILGGALKAAVTF
jgi:hypothetical protein